DRRAAQGLWQLYLSVGTGSGQPLKPLTPGVAWPRTAIPLTIRRQDEDLVPVVVVREKDERLSGDRAGIGGSGSRFGHHGGCAGHTRGRVGGPIPPVLPI